MNKKEQKKRKIKQHTVYNSYRNESIMKRLNLTPMKIYNYGFKRIIEEKATSEEIEYKTKIDVYNIELQDLLEKVEDTKEKIAKYEFLLAESLRITPEIKEKVFSEMKELFIAFEEEYLEYYEKHPEKLSDKIETFYSNKSGSISSIGRKYKLSLEEVISIYEESLAIEEALAEVDFILNAKHIE